MRTSSTERSFVNLSHVVWIGGTSCSGKTTVARPLAKLCGLAVYSTDDHFDRHAWEAGRHTQPKIYAYQRDDPVMDQRDQLPAEKAQLWRGFYAERFRMIATELAAGGPVVAEGVDLLPDCVAAVADPKRSAWLVPAHGFWEPRHFRERSWVESEQTAEAAERSWAYYRDMIDHHHERCAALGPHLIEVDGSLSAADITTGLAGRFGL